MEKLKWLDWLAAYGVRPLAEVLDCDVKTVQRWANHGALPKDVFKRKIVALANRVLDYNSFFEE